jgi:hypothetical protein
MQSRWYKAHQWFVAKHSSSNKVKCAVKTHVVALQLCCVPEDYPYPGRPERLTGNYHRINANIKEVRLGRLKAIVDGIFTESDCCQRYHFMSKIPTSEVDIPLDKHFRPKRNNYIYHYLIECYRRKQPMHIEEVVNADRIIRQCEHEIIQAQETIKSRERQLVSVSRVCSPTLAKYL